MASIANSRTANGGSGKAPISTHPAFPAIVALWFAALLGLGSMVLPSALFERAIEVTGIASFIPAASPPLGFTARALIAVAAAISGAVVGLVIARRIALAHEPRAERRFDPTFVTDSRRKPLSAHDELDGDGIADRLDGDADYAEPPSPPVTAPAGKRRTLAIAEENARSTYLYSVPLPGQSLNEDYGSDSTTTAAQDGADEVSTIPEHAPRAVNDFSLPRTPAAERIDAAIAAEAGEALELGEFAETMADTEISTGAVADREKQEQRLVASAATSNAPRQAQQDSSMNDSRNFQPFTSCSQDDGEDQEFATFSRLAEKELVSATGASNPPNDEPDAEPLPFAAPSLRRLKESEEQAEIELEEFEEEAFSARTEDFAENDLAPNLIAVPADDADVRSESPVGHAPLDELGLVQLAERLGLSIEKRRAWLAEHEADSGFALPRGGVNLADLEDAADPDEAARAMADYFGPRGGTLPDVTEMQPPATSFAIPHEFEPEDLAETRSEPDETQGEVPETAIPRVPASLSNVSLEDDDDDEDDFAASLSLPLSRQTFASPEDPVHAASALSFASPSAQDEEEDGDEDEDEGEYSSLLTMKNPFERRSEFVRIEEPDPEEDEIEPAVTFPSAKAQPSLQDDADLRPFDRPADGTSGASRPAAPGSGASLQQGDRHETERDLRSALAALQRMSGAA